MKPQLLIHTISDEVVEFKRETDVRNNMSISIKLSVATTGIGDFSKYIDPMYGYNNDDLLIDILTGVIPIIGIKS